MYLRVPEGKIKKKEKGGSGFKIQME